MKIHRRCLLPIAIAVTGFFALTTQIVKAAPYASCVTNNNGTIQFYLNESGGSVLVTYEDGTSNSIFDGMSSTATNLLSGAYSFSLAGHSSYAIAVTKYGTGVGGLASNVIQMANANFINPGNHVLLESGDPRGVAINANPASPYFGRIYATRGGGSGNPTGFFGMNADGSFFAPYTVASGNPTNAGVTTWTVGAPFSSPDRISITTNGFLVVGDYSTANSGVWLIDPNLNTNELLLGPPGDFIGIAAGVHGAIPAAPVLLGNIDTGATLITVDGDLHTNNVQVYSNITQSAIVANWGAGQGWQKAPDLTGPMVAINLQESPSGPGYYFFPKLAIGPNGFLYSGEFRGGVSAGDVPAVVIYDSTYTNLLWTSHYNSGTSDYFYTSVSGGSKCNPSDLAISSDGKYLAAANMDGHLTICMLTNGIPNVATIFTIKPDVLGPVGGLSDGGCEVAFDAADNPYEVIAGEYGMKQFTLGQSTTVTTYGNANGVTNCSVLPLTPTVSVYATNAPVISQANSYGNPTSGYFTIVRSGTAAALNQTMTVNISYSGTATNGTYTTGAASSVVFQPGQAVTNILITAVTDGQPRLTTALTLTVASSMTYTLSSSSATISILNTATPFLIGAVSASSMYNAFSNDYASMTITRLGDTNTTETVNTFTFAGTAMEGTDYTMPAPVTFVPGDLTHTVYISPLISGQPPVHNPSLTYTGNKSVILGVGSGTGYLPATNTATITIVDSAYPPATVLFTDPLTNSMDATNWGINAANGNLDNIDPDVDVEFGCNLYNTPSYPVPPPPNGATNALKMTVNKSGGLDDVIGNPMTAVNAYFTNAAFGGNYAVRFNMNIIQGSESTTLEQTISGYGIYDAEEGPLFGINNSGTETNWWAGDNFALGDSQTNFAADGFWYWVCDNGGAYFDTAQYIQFTGSGRHAAGQWLDQSGHPGGIYVRDCVQDQCVHVL